ncbi:hypothetical protein C0J52_20112 [Blattella germanica]|nr:hypothetical protein C0J52_20112 [Blattella germanica]
MTKMKRMETCMHEAHRNRGPCFNVSILPTCKFVRVQFKSCEARLSFHWAQAAEITRDRTTATHNFAASVSIANSSPFPTGHKLTLVVETIIGIFHLLFPLFYLLLPSLWLVITRDGHLGTDSKVDCSTEFIGYYESLLAIE